MVRFRTSWLVAVVAVGLVGAACKKDDDKKSDPAAADKSADKSGDKSGKADDKKPADPKPTDKPKDDKAPPAMAAKPITGQAGDDLALLPMDSEAVIGINFSQLQGSALWKKFVAPQIAKSDMSGLQKFKDVCGFDPLDAMKSVAIGVKGIGGTDPTGAIVVHGFDKAKSTACFDKNVGEAEKDGSKVTIDGDVVLITDKSGKKLGFTFVNDSTALMVLGPDAESKAKVKAVASGNTALNKSASFVELYNKLNAQDSIWMIVNGKSAAFQKVPMPFKLQALFGSLNVTDGLTVDLHMRLSSADEASNLVNTYKPKLSGPEVKMYFDKFDFSSEGPDVKVGVAISGQKLQQLAQMAMGMMGSMGGLGGMGGP